MKAKYIQADGESAVCSVCPHGCRIRKGSSGRCGVRRLTHDGEIAIGYGNVSSAHLDPVEKKPLYHFFPGKWLYSIGGYGCNLTCQFCQNWQISQSAGPLKYRIVDPAEVARQAQQSGAVGIAYTYNEPWVNYEFVMDCALASRSLGLKNVMVTNGYVNTAPARSMFALIDAVNIDVKSMDDDFYRRTCGGSLSPVLQCVREAVDADVHVELTNLLIPGLNSDEASVMRLVAWMVSQGYQHIPLHLTAYHPSFKTTIPPITSEACLRNAYVCASKQLDHVYIGNRMMAEGRDTICVSCGARLICRANGKGVVEKVTTEGFCSCCGKAVNIVR